MAKVDDSRSMRMSHVFNTPSASAEASVVPARLELTELIDVVCPYKVAEVRPALASHRDRVLSEDAEASVLVYGSHCTSFTESAWPRNACKPWDRQGQKVWDYDSKLEAKQISRC